MNTELKVTFLPEGKSVFVLPGTTIQEAALRAEIILDTPCGGNGTCGKCAVRLVDGTVEVNQAHHRPLTPEAFKQGMRLACQSKVTADCTIEVPAGARRVDLQILADGAGAAEEIDSPVRKQYVEATPGTTTRQEDEFIIRSRVEDRVRPDLAALRELPHALRENDRKVTLVVTGDRLIAVEPGNTSQIALGVAFDVGTTTMVGTLVDLYTGQQVATASSLNPQTRVGADVISRINAVQQDRRKLQALQADLIGEINKLINELLKTAQVKRECVYEATFTGNAVMLHFLLGITPEYLGQIPFSPVVKRSCQVRARELEIGIHPAGSVWVFPNIAGFVGGDTVACILASGLYKSEKVKLLVDIGTNGEIVLGNKDRLVAASTAAGPAFEGARISQGMRGSQGAIEKIIRSGDDLQYNVIGNVRPRGICGSGLIDLVAELLRDGIIDQTGRIVPAPELPTGLPERMRQRVEPDRDSQAFLVTDGATPIRLTQRDVREVQLGKGAIFSGIQILEQVFGIEDRDLSEVLLAGAFGNFIRRKNAVRIGLIPDIPREKIRFIGNAALAGAKLALVSAKYRQLADRVSETTGFVELAQQPLFQTVFAESMLFKEEAGL